MGELKQGYMLNASYEWNFALTNYDSQLSERQADVNALLTAELNLMEAEKRAAKVQENKLQAQQSEQVNQGNDKLKSSLGQIASKKMTEKQYQRQQIIELGTQVIQKQKYQSLREQERAAAKE